MASKGSRPGSRGKGRKGPQKGTGGHGRKALAGRGPTPKAEDRSYHPAAKRKAAKQRGAQAQRGSSPRSPRRSRDGELVTGRNSVLEALRAEIPASALYLALRLEGDERLKEIYALATSRRLVVHDVQRSDLDAMTDRGTVHQGVALAVDEYDYADPIDLFDATIDRGEVPLLVGLDGVTDPRNLGAIIRSATAFGGNGVIVPQRRSASMTAAAWKTSAGAAAVTPVALASNLTATLKELKKRGAFVIGLAGEGEQEVSGLTLADQPLVVVVGSEGSGLSRLVAENCDVVASIPIGGVESLNASVAAAIALYEVARIRRNAQP